jgi:hypothetical protein
MSVSRKNGKKIASLRYHIYVGGGECISGDISHRVYWLDPDGINEE